ncbi:MAG: NAD(P)-dependent oxidoreductase [Chloroflexi bacterium]|nr:NAD(P)-dependent oxidoreductase [Chloroflexota bacterium]
MKRKILITGAAGRIGSFLTNQWKDQYDLVLTDVRAPKETFGFPFTSANLTEMEKIQALCQGIDTVIHLGADPSMEAAWESLLPNNIIGTYNVFEAAAQANVRRVVYASSVNAVFGYPVDQQVHTSMPVYPINLYGATKCWGEAAARVYAHLKKFSAICLRFGAVSYRPGTNPEYDGRYTPDYEYLDIILTMEDLTKLVTASVEAADDLWYGVFQGVSNNRWKRLDITDARAIIGYEPTDDAFTFIKPLGSE